MSTINQWILPAVSCPAKHGTDVLVLEVRIQKSRKPRIDNAIGIWDANTTYNATFSGSTQTEGDVVYYGGSSYPGWRSIQAANVGNTPPANLAAWVTSGSLWWEPASNFDFVQGDFTKVFYLDQQIIAEGGLGQFIRSVSRQQGLITPDSRLMKFTDYTHYSGAYGVTVSPYAVGTNTGLIDLSTTDARTLLPFIFDDPDAYYTVFFSRVTGQGYDTNRELYNIGDIDFAKLTANYELDFMPGTPEALQKLSGNVQAEAVLNRLNSFTVKDLILTIGLADMDAYGAVQPFIGGQVLLGVDIPPTFPQIGNRYDLYGLTYDGRHINYSAGPLTYYHSRSNSRVQGVATNDPSISILPRHQNALIIATTSINDNLHFLKIETLMSMIAALVNFTWSSGDLGSLLAFWSDVVDQTTGILSSVNIALTEIGFCYEYLFNIDPRCELNMQEASLGGLSWNTPLGDAAVKIARSLVTYIKSGYDQTNFRAENALVDALTPNSIAKGTNGTTNGTTTFVDSTANAFTDAMVGQTITILTVGQYQITGYTSASTVTLSGSPAAASSLAWNTGSLPSTWEAAKGGIKPRVQSALHVAAKNRGYNDTFTCPNNRGTALAVEEGWRVKKAGLLGTNLGDSTVDIIQNSQLTAKDQWKTFQPLQGGLIDGGHVVGREWDTVSHVWSWSGVITHFDDSSYALTTLAMDRTGGDALILTDTAHEFVIAQESGGSVWNNSQDIYQHSIINYLTPTANGNSDTVCFWTDAANGAGKRCLYGAIYFKESRNEITIVLPAGGQNGRIDGSLISNPTPYVIGYTGFGLDGIICSDSAGTPGAGSYFKSAGYDFYNNDALGNQHVGQQIIIPYRGVFTIKNIANGSGAGPVSPSIIELDRPIIMPGTDLEFRIGGPTINPASFIIGTYFYYYNTTDIRFGPMYYTGDYGNGAEDGFFPSMFLGASHDSSSNANGWLGCYALSRMAHQSTVNSAGVVYGTSVVPDDTYGNSLKTFAQCQAALNLGSFQLVSRTFNNVLSDAGTMLGYGPLDGYAEHSQGVDQTYSTQTLTINERAGTVVADMLSTTKATALNDKNYPVTLAGSGASGSAGSGGGLGGSGGGGTTTQIFSTTIQTLAANTNDWIVPLTQWTDLYVSASAAVNLTGIANGNAGYHLTIHNTGTNAITITSGDVSSAAASRFLLPFGASIILGQNNSVSFSYDGTALNWRKIA